MSSNYLCIKRTTRGQTYTSLSVALPLEWFSHCSSQRTDFEWIFQFPSTQFLSSRKSKDSLETLFDASWSLLIKIPFQCDDNADKFRFSYHHPLDFWASLAFTLTQLQIISFRSLLLTSLSLHLAVKSIKPFFSFRFAECLSDEPSEISSVKYFKWAAHPEACHFSLSTNSNKIRRSLKVNATQRKGEKRKKGLRAMRSGSEEGKKENQINQTTICMNLERKKQIMVERQQQQQKKLTKGNEWSKQASSKLWNVIYHVQTCHFLLGLASFFFSWNGKNDSAMPKVMNPVSDVNSSELFFFPSSHAVERAARHTELIRFCISWPTTTKKSVIRWDFPFFIVIVPSVELNWVDNWFRLASSLALVWKKFTGDLSILPAVSLRLFCVCIVNLLKAGSHLSHFDWVMAFFSWLCRLFIINMTSNHLRFPPQGISIASCSDLIDPCINFATNRRSILVFIASVRAIKRNKPVADVSVLGRKDPNMLFSKLSSFIRARLITRTSR